MGPSYYAWAGTPVETCVGTNKLATGSRKHPRAGRHERSPDFAICLSLPRRSRRSRWASRLTISTREKEHKHVEDSHKTPGQPRESASTISPSHHARTAAHGTDPSSDVE